LRSHERPLGDAAWLVTKADSTADRAAEASFKQ
jgi:hypothetical protein